MGAVFFVALMLCIVGTSILESHIIIGAIMLLMGLIISTIAGVGYTFYEEIIDEEMD